MLPVALGLVIGGSVANLIDRVRLGHVTDFLDFRLLAGVQSRRHLHRRRRRAAVRLVRGVRPDEPAPWHGSAFTFLRTHAGARLDRVLAVRPELDSRALAERLIATGAVLVDGEPRAKSYRLEGGEEVDVEIPEAAELQPEELDIPIVWEDEHLLVVDKPAGLVVHPAGSTRTGTLVQGLLAHGAEGGDDETGPGSSTGSTATRPACCVVARSEEAHDAAAGADPLARASSARYARARPGHAAVAHRGGSRRRSAATAATAPATRSTRRRRASR